jgi:hypothetical protein
MSACTGAPVTVPESSAMGVFGADGSAGSVVLSLARTGAGTVGATSFSAPLLTVAGGGLVTLAEAGGGLVWLTEAGGGFVSLTRGASWGTGRAGLAEASVGFGTEASSCAPFVSARGGGVVRAVVAGGRTPQPARATESAARRIALETAARSEPATGGNLSSWERSRQSNRVLASSPPAGSIRLRASKSSLALMSNIVACVLFRPACVSLRRSTGSPRDPQQHGSRQTQLGRMPPFSYYTDCHAPL